MSRKKKKEQQKYVRPFRFSMRVDLTILVILEISVITAVIWVVALLLQHLHISLRGWEVLILLAVSILIGSSLTALAGRWIFSPITKLGEAMGRVAKGDFDIRLEEHHRFREIESIHRNFNLMVQELGNTEILQTDFVSNVSHEFKTPINAIEGYATLLQDCDGVSQDQQVYVQKILFNTRRLSRLVGNILLLSKVDNQAIVPQVCDFRLDEQIRQAIVALEPEWEQQDIDFDVDLQRVLYSGSESLLMHVWSNLIGNAIKFSPKGGYIGVRLAAREHGAIFSVEDRGPGVPEESREHIFNRFYQTDSSHREEGNGLGLALVKQILTAVGGTVRVENLPVGCRFVVELP